MFGYYVQYLHLRKFHFSEVHVSMNATGHLQSNFARDPGVAVLLPWTSQKWNSSLIFTLCFYIVFVHHLWNFYLNLANKRRRKVLIRRVWLLRSTAVTMTWRQSNVNQLLHLSITSRTRNVGWTSVVLGCMNLVGPKQAHLRKLLSSVNMTWRLTNVTSANQLLHLSKTSLARNIA